MQTVDLFLACACAQGQPAAISALEHSYFPQVRARLDPRIEAAAIDDVISRMREELFVGRPGRQPKIVQYAGLSTLPTYLQSVANRMALRLLTSEQRLDHREKVAQHALASQVADPELERLKLAYRDWFQSALREAAAALSVRDRTLLRFQHVDALTGDEIARFYRVSRQTVVRWLRDARDALAEGTRARLMVAAGSDRRDFDSITRLVQSQLDFSIRGLLASVEVNRR